MSSKQDARRHLPSVDKVLQALQDTEVMARHPHERIVAVVREALDDIRETLPGREIPSIDEIAERVVARLQSQEDAGLRRVVNAAGVVLHTGLGRAVLAQEAVDALAITDACCDVQIDLDKGTRGRRDAVIEQLLQTLTGAEAATIVNNNAAATLLVLAALCRDKEVIVSRGQLIEIGGSFRLPDVIRESGACMVEVGTTNKTHLHDYENAITEETAVLLRVNPSNYRIIGFAKQVSTAELATLKSGREIIVIDDLGCGALVDLERCGLPSEPTVQDSIAQGADVALFSGDKLIGGPQCGIIVGRAESISRIRKHPLARALRVGKLTIAALEATLKLFLHPDTVWEKNPTLRMLAAPYDELRARADDLAERLSQWIACEVIESESVCGGGALPDSPLKTTVVALNHKSLSAQELARRLRLHEPPVIPRIQDECVQLDVRTLLPGDDERIESAVKSAVKNAADSVPPHRESGSQP